MEENINPEFRNRLRNFLFGSGKKTDSSTTQTVSNNSPADSTKADTAKTSGPPSPFDDLTLHFGDATLVPIALKDLFDSLNRKFRLLGEQKGRLGHNDMHTVNALAQSEAKLFFERVKAEVSGKLEAFKLEAKFKTENYEKMKDNYVLQKKYYDAFLNERRSSPNSFSIPMAGFYIIIGILLLIADCVLALNLMRIAFDFPSPLEPEFQLDSLGTEPFKPIFWHNWQVIVTSVGIALLSIYIKIFYDEYVGSTDGNRQLRIHYIIDILSYRTRKEDDNELLQGELPEKGIIEKELRNEQRSKFWVRSFLLFCTVLLLSLLAYLRYYAEIDLAASNGNTSVFQKHPTTGIAIFMLTLLFPVVAGICISLSLKVWQNLRGYKESEKGLKNAKSLLDEAFEKYQQSEQKRIHARQTLETWIDKDSFLLVTEKCMIAHYMNGYSVDHVNPDRNDLITDIVERMAQFRNKMTARNNYKHLNKTSI